MNTPSHHRVHHGRNARYLDVNYAGVFIIWDKLFGTFVPELDEEKPDYGLVHNIATFNPIRVAFHEWVGIFRDVAQPGITWRDRLMYCVAPPGWSHDGSQDSTEKKGFQGDLRIIIFGADIRSERIFFFVQCTLSLLIRTKALLYCFKEAIIKDLINLLFSHAQYTICHLPNF